MNSHSIFMRWMPIVMFVCCAGCTQQSPTTPSKSGSSSTPSAAATRTVAKLPSNATLNEEIEYLRKEIGEHQVKRIDCPSGAGIFVTNYENGYLFNESFAADFFATLANTKHIKQLHLCHGAGPEQDQVLAAAIPWLKKLHRLEVLTFFEISTPEETLGDILSLPNLKALEWHGAVSSPEVLSTLENADLEQLTIGVKSDADLHYFSHLKSLRTLNLSIRSLEGDGIGVLGELPALRQLKLSVYNGNESSSNDVDLCQLKGLDKLTQITELRLSGQRFGNCEMQQLGQLTNLKSLDLRFSNFQDQHAKSLVELNNLEYLNLRRTKITDSSLKLLSTLTKLSSLVLTETNLNNEALETLSQFPALKKLDLSNTSIDMGNIESLSRFSQLEVLKIGTKFIGKEEREEIGKLFPDLEIISPGHFVTSNDFSVLADYCSRSQSN